MGKTKVHWCPICGKNVRHGDNVHGIKDIKEKKARKEKKSVEQVKK